MIIVIDGNYINTDKTCMIIFRKGRKVTQHDHQFFDDKRLYLLEKNLIWALH